MWQRVLEAYVARLRSHPFSTNAASALVVCGAGDVLAQRYESGRVDAYRTAKLAGWGALWMGPAGVVWYAFLERRGGGLARKVVTNQLVFAPTTNALFYLYNEALRSGAAASPPLLDRYATRMRHEFVPTMCTSVVAWVPAQALNLSLVPLPFRPLFLNTCFVLWTAYLSHRGHRTYDQREKPGD